MVLVAVKWEDGLNLGLLVSKYSATRNAETRANRSKKIKSGSFDVAMW